MTTLTRLAGLTRTLDDVVQELDQRIATTQPADQVDRLDRFEWNFDGADPVATRHDGQRLVLNRRALTQLMGRLQIPVRFFDRLPADLKWANVAHFVRNGDYERDVTLRKVFGNRVRAILSDRYAPLDDNQIIPFVAKALRGQKTAVEWAMVDDVDYSHVRVLFGDMIEEVRPGDPVVVGLHVTNSEVGLRSVRVEPFLHRLATKSGFVAPETLFRTTARHVGDPARLEGQIQNAVTTGLIEAQKMIDLFRRAAGTVVPDGAKLIEHHAKAQNLSDAQVKAVIGAFLGEVDHTIYGVVNAFAKGAQEFDPETRYGVERAGGRLLARV